MLFNLFNSVHTADVKKLLSKVWTDYYLFLSHHYLSSLLYCYLSLSLFSVIFSCFFTVIFFSLFTVIFSFFFTVILFSLFSFFYSSFSASLSFSSEQSVRGTVMMWWVTSHSTMIALIIVFNKAAELTSVFTFFNISARFSFLCSVSIHCLNSFSKSLAYRDIQREKYQTVSVITED